MRTHIVDLFETLIAALNPVLCLFIACICISIVGGGVMLALIAGMHECLMH